MGVTLSKGKKTEIGTGPNSTNIFTINNHEKLDLEKERSCLRHDIVRVIFNGNFSSPIYDLLKSGAKVLDIGCGQGTWICEMSSDFPNSEFVGTEIVDKIIPHMKPLNVSVVKANVLEGLPFQDNQFDFVNIRNLLYDFTESQWENLVIPECIRVLKNGGWIEVSDAELKVENCGKESFRVINKMLKFLESKNVNPFIVYRLEEFMNSKEKLQRFEHISRPFQLGVWNNALQDPCARYSKDTFDVLAKFADPKSNIDAVTRTCMKECTINRSYFNVHRFYGQKL
ncbi:S-adenosyl-L-methionine-dependent methyltransferase [Gigaspora rosea]|uniref:S-adenosyl-L-methionine-dependent methyltransferase n=1 Tax=Gigaspora rosea TaxID=44941 RepID=A0A397WE96_9GLOM|nr:S-adenosyl-L-methionine-dependent methyltransferase [Gigaspora rosea]